MNVLKLISSTNACMLVIMPLHHAMSPCHIIMPHQPPCHHATSAAMSSYHIIMPCHHATSYCHVSMPHHHAMSLEFTFLLPRGSLRECHMALQPKFSLLGPNFKMQYLLHPESVWNTVCTVGIRLMSSYTWYYFCCNMIILKIGLFRSSQIIRSLRSLLLILNLLYPFNLIN